jgi:hypothetical protein
MALTPLHLTAPSPSTIFEIVFFDGFDSVAPLIGSRPSHLIFLTFLTDGFDRPAAPMDLTVQRFESSQRREPGRILDQRFHLSTDREPTGCTHALHRWSSLRGQSNLSVVKSISSQIYHSDSQIHQSVKFSSQSTESVSTPTRMDSNPKHIRIQ